MPAAVVHPSTVAGQNLMPREHGALAMLLTPFFAAAILARRFDWPELVALLAIWCAFAIKDPLVVLARQRFVWKQPHPETPAARRSAALRCLLAAGCGAVLLLTIDWRPLLPLFLGGAAFTVLAVIMNVRNRQRSEWFQAASAVALSSTCLMASLSATGEIATWCWSLWLLCSLQAAAGIFVVHARLDARIAARRNFVVPAANRRIALLMQFVLVLTGALAAYFGRPWIAAALLLAAAGYLMELRRQHDAASLQFSLKRIGLEALTLSTVYSALLIAGLR